mgnify:CR=1 FL=1
MANIEELSNYKHIHMIGIGGISMSGIAEILKNWGFTVTGSDTNSSNITDALIRTGIPVKIGHDLDNVAKADLVVYSAAIKNDDIELCKARELGIETIERGTFLGKLTKAFKNSICISGTHGKTTTTSMISVCFLQAFKDPSIQVGAVLKQLNSNYRVGNSEYFIIEACEYVESYLKLFPKTEVVLNIDDDHLDYFGSLDNIVKSFEKYVKLLPDNGLLVVNYDDINCRKLVKNTNAKIISYGIDTQNANFVARNITFNSNGFPTFDVYYNDNFYKINVYHLDNNTSSDVFNRIVAKENSSNYFDINSYVDNGIKDCYLNQSTKIVTLGDSDNRVNPNMFISEEDVTAIHSSTIGSINEEDLFYLMSRGISYNDSVKLIIKGMILSNINPDMENMERILSILDSIGGE